MSIIEVDIHGRHPRQIMGLPLQQLVEEAWKSGVTKLVTSTAMASTVAGPKFKAAAGSARGSARGCNATIASATMSSGARSIAASPD
jgi:hypothetical protein